MRASNNAVVLGEAGTDSGIRFGALDAIGAREVGGAAGTAAGDDALGEC